MAQRISTLAALSWLIAATAGATDDASEPPAHCSFLNGLAQFDLSLHQMAGDSGARSQALVAIASGLQQEIRAPKVAGAFSELETVRIEAYLAAQQRAFRTPGDTAAVFRHARTQHPLPWRGQAFAQKLALCNAQGGSARPLDTGAGTGDQDGDGDESALAGELRSPVGSATLHADLFSLLTLLVGTICLALILRPLVGRDERRSLRVYCYVPVTYSTGTHVRQGWLVDLSCHGCKLQTRGDSLDAGTPLWIAAGAQELTGTVAWSNRHSAGIDLQRALNPAQVERIAFGRARDVLEAE